MYKIIILVSAFRHALAMIQNSNLDYFKFQLFTKLTQAIHSALLIAFLQIILCPAEGFS